MAAHRSRTTGWRKCLQQLLDYKGSLQIALSPNGMSGRDFIWSAAIIDLNELEIVVEMPTAAGQPLPLEAGLGLMGIMAIGQNRWMFKTMCLGQFMTEHQGKQKVALRLKMPSSVERCQRRRDYRISTCELQLPEVQSWPLLDPRSVVLPERMCQLAYEQFDLSQIHKDVEETMPQVGPPASARMVNIGGGGIGLQLSGKEGSSALRHRMHFLKFNLPHIDGPPLCVTTKLMHHHLEAGGTTYMGMMFDFSLNPSHKQFVVTQITRSVAIQQREQLKSAS